MNKKQKLREELEKDSLSSDAILAIKRLHSDGRTTTEISEGLDLYESTISAALSRGIHPTKEAANGA